MHTLDPCIPDYRSLVLESAENRFHFFWDRKHLFTLPIGISIIQSTKRNSEGGLRESRNHPSNVTRATGDDELPFRIVRRRVHLAHADFKTLQTRSRWKTVQRNMDSPPWHGYKLFAHGGHRLTRSRVNIWFFEGAAERWRQVEIAFFIFALVRAIRGPWFFARRSLQ